MGAKAAKAQLRAMAMRRCAFHTNPPVILIAIAAVQHRANERQRLCRCLWMYTILGYGFWTAHRCVCSTEILYKPTRDDSRAAKVDSTSCAALIMICVRCSRKANIISCGNSREARKDCADSSSAARARETLCYSVAASAIRFAPTLSKRRKSGQFICGTNNARAISQSYVRTISQVVWLYFVV